MSESLAVAVMTLTRDRLEYTKHCLQTLWDNAGCEFDHWIADNGSRDGTVEWLLENTDATVTAYSENAGISPALNAMLDEVLAAADYDVIVKIDNDCELLTPNTLRDICELVDERGALLSPWIRGLRQPPQPGYSDGVVTEMSVIGGIFTAAPAWIYKEGYRHPIIATLDGEDFNLCQWYRHGVTRDAQVGYVDGYEANHYRTTDGQHADYPAYFSRREQERREVRMLAW